VDRRDIDRSPARLYAGIVGATLVVAGIVGFFYNAAFTSDKSMRDAVFGIFDVNGWHNMLHILTGALGLLAFTSGAYAARRCAIALGALYLVIAAWGFIVGDGDSILSIIPVNTEDNVLHMLLGVLGLAAGFASAPSTTVDRVEPATG
jgi:hypothetical protein